VLVEGGWGIEDSLEVGGADAVARDTRWPHTRDPAASIKQNAGEVSCSMKGPVVRVRVRREKGR
jgi:hypothetical protein